MNRMIISRLGRATAALAAILLLGAALPAQAGNVLNKPEFKITLPKGWVEVPHQAMVTFNQNVARAMAKLPKNRIPYYEYAFQPASNKGWLSSYPYVVVRLKTSGRIPENELAKIEKVDINKEMHKHKKEMPAIVNRLQMGKPLYDPSTHTIWLSANMTGPDGNPIHALSAMIATNDGYLQISSYAPKASFKKFYLTFRRMVASVVIPAKNRY